MSSWILPRLLFESGQFLVEVVAHVDAGRVRQAQQVEEDVDELVTDLAPLLLAPGGGGVLPLVVLVQLDQFAHQRNQDLYRLAPSQPRSTAKNATPAVTSYMAFPFISP